MVLKKYSNAVSILILIAGIYFSFYTLFPNLGAETNVTDTEFSTEKALVHLKNISKKPHYTGSKEHAVVRNYIVEEFEKLGLKVEIQEQLAINSRRTATATKNILTRIKGSESGKALLLLTHYDSSPHSSFGASDAGSGVVVILEGVRAFLTQNKVPKNDIIICISDAEELGLLGANAFVNYHPWAKDIGLVLNFEARGSGGPSYMLVETNGGNKNLIEAFKKANTPYPVANSLMYSVYKMLPNDTDLTVFRENKNIDGFNFAFIDDFFDYHTAQDIFNRLDLNTLQHQASYLMAGLNYFSNSDLENLKAEEDFVYFNFPYFGMVFYPFSWVLPMVLICTLLFLVLLGVGFSNKKLTIIGVLKGLIPFIGSLLITSLGAFYGWKFLLKIHPNYTNILHGFTYNGYYYIAAFVALTIAICFWFYKGFFKKRTAQDLVIAPIFSWILINFGIAFYLPGAAFFIIPVFILLLILAILLFGKQQNNLILFSIAVLPILVIFSPLIKMFPVGLGLKMLVISTVFTVLLFGLLIPIFQQYKNQKKAYYLFLFIGFMALISASVNSGYSEERKQPNSIVYVYDTTINEAYWGSYNTNIDSFTTQFLGENPIKGSYKENSSASKYNTKINLHKQTEIVPLKQPTITIVSDTIINSNRRVCLSIYSNRNANKIELRTAFSMEFMQFKVNEVPLKKAITKDVLKLKPGTVLSYYRTSENEIIDLELVVSENQQLEFDIFESKYDLLTNPLFKIEPRPSTMMPMPFVLNDATIIKSNIKL
ncbi:M28 family peptidase [Lutibacter sp. A64]|uniref:M28 family peptidase n=1 Tax=Lutibacter sp. A64 TaxID=2918526 RepID=UPI001F050611|nr:M28 family peptidase [Lutibacter sp. A64]UMB52901.1 M28 family peptidase [Lutibacter sp. A64]